MQLQEEEGSDVDTCRWDCALDCMHLLLSRFLQYWASFHRFTRWPLRLAHSLPSLAAHTRSCSSDALLNSLVSLVLLDVTSPCRPSSRPSQVSPPAPLDDGTTHSLGGQAPSAHPHRASQSTSRRKRRRTSTHGSWAETTRAHSRSTRCVSTLFPLSRDAR